MATETMQLPEGRALDPLSNGSVSRGHAARYRRSGQPSLPLPLAFIIFLKARTSRRASGESTSAIERWVASENGSAGSSQPCGRDAEALGQQGQ